MISCSYLPTCQCAHTSGQYFLGIEQQNFSLLNKFADGSEAPRLMCYLTEIQIYNIFTKILVRPIFAKIEHRLQSCYAHSFFLRFLASQTMQAQKQSGYLYVPVHQRIRKVSFAHACLSFQSIPCMNFLLLS